MRQFLLLAIGALRVLGSTTASGEPNVIVITLDTMRADRLGCYGYFRETTPHLDAFAEEAILFENAITHMSTTLPAHLSLFTSAHPIRHGVQGNLSPTMHAVYEANAAIPTAACIFAELGYETAAFISAAPLKKVTGISAGFQTFREPEEQECRAEETTTAVLEWLSSHRREPFFLWVHYFDPHDIYSAPPPYRRFFSTDDALLQYLRANEFPHWDRLDIQHLSNMYDGEVRYMDAEIGRLFGALRNRGLWEEAAIVIAGDHGEGLGQHDFVRHGPLNAELLRVPLMLRLPSMAGGDGERRSRLTALIDVLPTLVEELGLNVSAEIREQFEGRNMLKEPAWEYVFSERTHERAKKLGPGLQYSLTGRDWKYLYATEQPDELYDLRTDPFELRNVLEEHPDVAQSLRLQTLSRIARMTRSDPATVDSLPAEYVDQLRALGYVE